MAAAPLPWEESWTGGYLGRTRQKFGPRRSTEFWLDDAITNIVFRFRRCRRRRQSSPATIRPWNNIHRRRPPCSFDLLSQTIQPTFTGGQVSRTTTHWIATVGAKGGTVVTRASTFTTGGRVLAQPELNVNFATAASSNVTTPAYAGIGGELPATSMGRCSETRCRCYPAISSIPWWGTVDFNNAPRPSPAFNYAFNARITPTSSAWNILLSRMSRRPQDRQISSTVEK